ncbi:hypothetical protein ACIQNI_28625 [Streptomyces sp. NPDC091266]|uniref:MmyB family transcriptional regulator n=1 Tax=Streptomyces sp. NPDC091266 TaxID=3365978 RepID=UPI003829FC9E
MPAANPSGWPWRKSPTCCGASTRRTCGPADLRILRVDGDPERRRPRRPADQAARDLVDERTAGSADSRRLRARHDLSPQPTGVIEVNHPEVGRMPPSRRPPIPGPSSSRRRTAGPPSRTGPQPGGHGGWWHTPPPTVPTRRGALRAVHLVLGGLGPGTHHQ